MLVVLFFYMVYLCISITLSKCQAGYHLSNNFFVFLTFSARDQPSVTPWSGSWSRGWWQRRAGADHWPAYPDIGGDETSDSDMEAPTRHRQTIMAACYGDTQPSGTAMASLSRHQPSNRGSWLTMSPLDRKSWVSSRIKDSPNLWQVSC